MRTLKFLLISVLFFPTLVLAQVAINTSANTSATSLLATSPVLDAKSWLLLEYPSGQILSVEKENERVEPASITKIMTAYLAFAAIKEGKLKLEQPILISEKAWKAEGSRMFIEVNKNVAVEDLLKGMIVQSGNDAAVALAEAIGGSEEAFAAQMTETAKKLGMNATQFRNATGLPNADHFSTAHDLGKLASALIRDFPAEYKTYYSIKEFTFNKIKQPNRNRLLWVDKAVDGMKTGFTDNAGYCLVASAKRDERRLISVVLGADSDKARAAESLKLLNFGFQNFETKALYAKEENVSAIKIWKGAASSVKSGFNHDFALAIPAGQKDKIKTEIIAEPRLMAPIAKGQMVGTLRVTLEGANLGDFPIVALEEIGLAGFFGRLIDTIRLWFN